MNGPLSLMAKSVRLGRGNRVDIALMRAFIAAQVADRRRFQAVQRDVQEAMKRRRRTEYLAEAVERMRARAARSEANPETEAAP